jgi:hypothetical protein
MCSADKVSGDDIYLSPHPAVLGSSGERCACFFLCARVSILPLASATVTSYDLSETEREKKIPWAYMVCVFRAEFALPALCVRLCKESLLSFGLVWFSVLRFLCLSLSLKPCVAVVPWTAFRRGHHAISLTFPSLFFSVSRGIKSTG